MHSVVVILGCDAFITLNGRVIDQERRSVAGATVKVVAGCESTTYTIDENGKFRFFDHTSPIGSETIRIYINKAGYDPIVADEIDSKQIGLPNLNAKHEVEYLFTLEQSAGNKSP